MEAFLKIVNEQAALATEIDKVFSNFKKDGPERKNRDYLIKRINHVKKTWLTVKENHELIRTHEGFASSEYGSKNFLSDIKSVICKFLGELGAKLSEDEEYVKERPEILTISDDFKNEVDEWEIELETKVLSLQQNLSDNASKTSGKNLSDNALSGNGSTNANENLSGIVPEVQNARVSANHLHVKLPKMEIPKFKGDIRKWRNFKDMFTKLVHEKTEISDIEKFTYLRTYLENEPLNLIAHFDVSAATYAIAWESLISRYNNTRALIDAEIDFLLESADKRVSLKLLHDTTREALYNLKALGASTEHWDPILVRITMKKLDAKSIDAFEDSLDDSKVVPSMENLLKFIEKRFQKLDQVRYMSNINVTSEKPKTRVNLNATKAVNGSTARKVACFKCNGNHPLYKCDSFLNQAINERFKFVKGKGLCVNCLSHEKSSACKSTLRCKKCNKFHHNLLHFEEKVSANNSVMNSEMNAAVAAAVGILPTAVILVSGKGGYQHKLRALIDSGSQATFISRAAAELINAPLVKRRIDVTGVGVTSALKSEYSASIKINSLTDSNFELKVAAIILPKLTGLLPSAPNVKMLKWTKQAPWPLADPSRENYKGIVDVILGADCFVHIMNEGMIKSAEGYLAQATVFGWVIQGKGMTGDRIVVNTLTFDASRLQELWELPDAPEADTKKTDIEFKYERNGEDGKFIVRLPFKSNDFELGDSRKMALARYFNIERALEKKPKMKKDYDDFLAEYIEMGHMSQATSYGKPEEKEYFIPHHAVVREESLTTKLRVVFDASAKSDLNVSLNDVLETGPLLLSNLWKILLRFRMNRVAFVSDISKMYRQIWVHPDDRKFQKIFWRFNKREPVKEYLLNTVTYGVVSAPYLAIRCLKQIALDNVEVFPESAATISNDFYMDDLLSGADSIAEAQQRIGEISALMESCGFPLKKWASNKVKAIENVAKEDRVDQYLEFKEDLDHTIKTLGIAWNFSGDTFKISVVDNPPEKLTKRTLLSYVAKIFDPQGWLTPVLIRAKLLVQELWQDKLDWDRVVEEIYLRRFLKLHADLQQLTHINIPRFCGKAKDFQLIGFADASGRAYGACVYMKTELGVYLLTSKSRVNPIKNKTTLPRLELMGCVLLAELMDAVISTMDQAALSIHLFTDSEIVLAWMRNPSLQFKVFVGPRVKKILSLTNIGMWRHVRSEDNPADIISRGVSAEKFMSSKLWWSGPAWVAGPVENYPNKDTPVLMSNSLFAQEVEPEDNPPFEVVQAALVFETEQWKIIENTGEWGKLTRVIAYCLRCLHRGPSNHLTVNELEKAELAIVRLVQRTTFTYEHDLLMKRKLILKGNLASLNPFLDDQQIMRVGGRLRNSNLPFNQKHPMILPKKHNVVELLIRHAHKLTLHGGNQEVHAWLRQKFWILNGREAIRSELHKCMKCFRYRAPPIQQQMGNLPEARVTPSSAFENCGVDFAGPISMRLNALRKGVVVKGYFCVFVCLSTKAIHLEVVSDLTTNAFLAALKRFFARRGYCRNLYSDNGKTFLCAQTRLTKEREAIEKFFKDTIHSELHNHKVQWHFIPPYSPNFGGLWEAGVKSTKYHLKRIMGDKLFTYEEMATVLTQIEAILNSRPLCPMTADINDVDFLTPGHFLIGRALVALPETSITNETMTGVERFRRCQIVLQQFWKKWSIEYLIRLQQRPKWLKAQPNLEIGDLVLVRESFLPPTQWKAARVIKLHPGKDDHVRVATLFDGKKEIIRNVRMLSKLPMERPKDLEGSELAAGSSSGEKEKDANKNEGLNNNKPVRQSVEGVKGKAIKRKRVVKPATKATNIAEPPQVKKDTHTRDLQQGDLPLPTASTSAAPTPGLRRSPRGQGKLWQLGGIHVLTLGCIVMLLNGANAFKVRPLNNTGLFVHHEKTVFVTEGSFSIAVESNIYPTKLRIMIEQQILGWNSICDRIQFLRNKQTCVAYGGELQNYYLDFENALTNLHDRAKRSKGILTRIFDQLSSFIFGDDELDLVEEKEENDAEAFRKAIGNLMMKTTASEKMVMDREKAVQSEFYRLKNELNSDSFFGRVDQTRVGLYLHQVFTAIIRMIEHVNHLLLRSCDLDIATKQRVHDLVNKNLPENVSLTEAEIEALMEQELITNEEPLSYLQLFPILSPRIFDEVKLISIPNFENRTRPTLNIERLLISADRKEYILNNKVQRKGINDRYEVILEPVMIEKVTNATPCEVNSLFAGGRCFLQTELISNSVDEWHELTDGQYLYVTENWNEYKISCDDNTTRRLNCSIGLLWPDDCKIESDSKVILPFAHLMKKGWAVNYHLINLTEAENAIEEATDKIELDVLPDIELDEELDKHILIELQETLSFKPHSNKWWAIVGTASSLITAIGIYALLQFIKNYFKNHEANDSLEMHTLPTLRNI